jgi:hypothetical protein
MPALSGGDFGDHPSLEGGAHQSIGEPLIGFRAPGDRRFEPACRRADDPLPLGAEEIQREAGEVGLFPSVDAADEQPGRPITPIWRRRSSPEPTAGAGAGAEPRSLLRSGARTLAAHRAGRRYLEAAAGNYLARSAAPRLARRPGPRAKSASPSAPRAAAPAPRSSPSRLSPGDLVVARRRRPATRSSRSASTAANRAKSPTSTAYHIDADAIPDAAARARSRCAEVQPTPGGRISFHPALPRVELEDRGPAHRRFPAPPGSRLELRRIEMPAAQPRFDGGYFDIGVCSVKNSISGEPRLKP